MLWNDGTAAAAVRSFQTGIFILLPIESPSCRQDIVVTKSEEGWNNPAVRDFYRFLVAYTKQM